MRSGNLTRENAARLGRETVEILERGRYRTASGAWVSIRSDLAVAVDGTEDYPPDSDPPVPSSRFRETEFHVGNTTTLAAARHLAATRLPAASSIVPGPEDTKPQEPVQSPDPVLLNFASARHPGGGFLKGSRAQEESLCRSSSLYFCIRDRQMYDHNSRLRSLLYSHYALYSPGVTFFRADDGLLLDSPFRAGVITAPAVNRSQSKDRSSTEVTETMRDRIERVLRIGAFHGHGSIVLGAWGCGVFRNSPDLIAGLFHEALHGSCQGFYRRVVFAVLDASKEQRTIGPFLERFGR